jgi:hypothetical protein
MDICSITFVTTTLMMSPPAVGCVSTMDNCHTSTDGKRMLCMATPCKTELPPPIYECRRPDGSTYIYQPTEK